LIFYILIELGKLKRGNTFEKILFIVSGFYQMSKDYSNGTNYFYNQGYDAATGNYEPSIAESVGQGVDCLLA
jgi:hypothetical protein